jgi:hypothetical protein
MDALRRIVRGSIIVFGVLATVIAIPALLALGLESGSRIAWAFLAIAVAALLGTLIWSVGGQR